MVHDKNIARILDGGDIVEIFLAIVQIRNYMGRLAELQVGFRARQRIKYSTDISMEVECASMDGSYKSVILELFRGNF